jgi:hypothetical protein
MQVKVGEVYNDNLVVVRKLGWGHFSTVWCAWDRKRKSQVSFLLPITCMHRNSFWHNSNVTGGGNARLPKTGEREREEMRVREIERKREREEMCA